MMGWWNKLVREAGIKKKIDEPVVEKTQEEIRRAALEAEKQQATKDKKPWVAVLDTQVNPENIKNGFFELDWNNEFIEQLMDAGYAGDSQEAIVDQWWKAVVSQMLEEDGQNPARDKGYISTTKVDKDKSKVS